MGHRLNLSSILVIILKHFIFSQKWAIPSSFYFIFVFLSITNFTTNESEKCPSSTELGFEPTTFRT